jgi:hypothetical protein
LFLALLLRLLAEMITEIEATTPKDDNNIRISNIKLFLIFKLQTKIPLV